MPASFEAPLLTVDLEQMHRIDTKNVESLFGLWSVFSRCSDTLDQGYRYENMSWRLWGSQVSSRKPSSRRRAPSSQLDRTPRQSTKDLPQLSSSVDSASSEEYDCMGTDPARSSPVTITGSASSPPFAHVNGSGRWKGGPSSPGALGRMVLSIKETKVEQRGDMPALAPSVTAAIRPVLVSSDVLPASQASNSPQEGSVQHKRTVPRASASSASTVPMSSPEGSITRSNTCGSETSAEFISTPDVVRGFTPTSISSHRASYASPRPEPMPIKSSMRQPPDAAAAKQSKFMLGGSSEEESSSLEESMSLRKPGMVAPRSAAGKDPSTVKQASFSDNVQTRMVPNEADEDAIASDDEDDDVDESAIEEEDDDDEEDWDDYSDAEEPPPPPQFGRIDSSTRLTSRRSLLTTGLHQSEREHAMLGLATTNAAAQAERRRSRQASSNGPSLGTSVDEEQPMEMQGIKITRTKPALGSPSAVQHPPALSPRTTRRNMLATELTESLRRHLLWERQQKNTTANAHLRRRHTSHDMANLHQYPERASPEDAGSRNNSWNSVFDTGLGEYHSRGW